MKNKGSFEKWLQNTKEGAKFQAAEMERPGEISDTIVSSILNALSGEPSAKLFKATLFAFTEDISLLCLQTKGSYQRTELNGCSSLLLSRISPAVAAFIAEEVAKQTRLNHLLTSRNFEITRRHSETEDFLSIITPNTKMELDLTDLGSTSMPMKYILDVSGLSEEEVLDKINVLDKDEFIRKETNEGITFKSKQDNVSFLLKDYAGLDLEAESPGFYLFKVYNYLIEQLKEN